MNKSDRILVLGSRGLVGSTILQELQNQGYSNLLHPLREELDLTRQGAVEDYFHQHKPTVVFLAAAKVGGIHANDTFRAEFIFENLQIQQNTFNAAFKAKTQNLLFLGSSCIYPKEAPQPLKEEYLLTSALEQTNEPYAIAKIAGLKVVESFRRQYSLNWISVMPTNLYGINDNFHLENSHVIPGLIARMQVAIDKQEPEFKIWGTGTPKREFLFVEDMARACIHLMKFNGDKPSFVNIGSGEEIQIKDLAAKIASKMNYQGKLVFDQSKPDGTMRKLMDNSKINEMGWKPVVNLDQGLDIVIKHFQQNRNLLRKI